MSAIAIVTIIAASCSGSAESAAHHKFVLVGSTACDQGIKAALGIPGVTKCDFIKWNLTLDQATAKTFTLDVTYGEGQPNTSGFIGGGKRIVTTGKFEVTTGPADREIFRLRSTRPSIDVSLLQLNANLFHLLELSGTMMIGNGGWSYTLNRNPAVPGSALPAPIRVVSENSPEPSQAIFIGRTPCREISELAGVPHGSDCFKLKWKLTLNRDAGLQPTTFTIESTFARDKAVTGRWSITKNTDATIYRLEPDASMKPVSLVVVDANHLLFLDAASRPLVGNADFSYTLDRQQ